MTIGCPPPGFDCRVSVAATARVPARRRQVKLGRTDYFVEAGSSAKARFKLTRNARSLLRRLTRIRAKVAITVTRGSSVTNKTVTIRLKAPRRTS